MPKRVAIFIQKTKEDRYCQSQTWVYDTQPATLTTRWSWTPRSASSLGASEATAGWATPSRRRRWCHAWRSCVTSPNLHQLYLILRCQRRGCLFYSGATNASRECTLYPKAGQDLCYWRIPSLACGKNSIIVGPIIYLPSSGNWTIGHKPDLSPQLS